MAPRFVPFRPALEGPLASRFFREIRTAVTSGSAESIELASLADAEVAWSQSRESVNPLQHAIFRACWLLLRDLHRIGWRLRWRSNTLELGRPELASKPSSPAEICAHKQAVREAMSFARTDRIEQYREFIERVLSPSPNGLATQPMQCLIADGREIARDLTKAARARSDEKRSSLLRTALQPYLQLVNENERCEHTGHRLSDIWRFFRFTWANPPETTPGRTLLYLIRDASRPFHPVMGLLSLENSALRIACRDHALGWTPDSIVDEFVTARDSKAVRRRITFLMNSLEGGLDGIDLRGLCRQSNVANPTPAVIRKLADIARESDADRMAAIKAWKANEVDTSDLEQSGLGNISVEAEDALYRRKRAEQLYRLLSAKRSLQRLLSSSTLVEDAQAFATSESGQSAIRTALVSNKNRHVGTSILELNVCGAIPPYNHLLGGKLAALLALSPVVVFDYRNRYGKRPSDIASRMKGSPVVRPAELVFVGTTSLYAGGTSQYNRLRIPRSLFGSKDDVHWQKLGETDGYGTLHISRETLAALEAVLEANNITLRANHIFGEGASPKFRSVRAGIEALLVPRQRSTADTIGRHEMKRLVFGATLASNARDVLSGTDVRPRYYFGRTTEPATATDRIVEYWRDRWLSSRIRYRPAIRNVEEFNPENWLNERFFDNLGVCEESLT